jgi:hypothetical protein
MPCAEECSGRAAHSGLQCGTALRQMHVPHPVQHPRSRHQCEAPLWSAARTSNLRKCRRLAVSLLSTTYGPHCLSPQGCCLKWLTTHPVLIHNKLHCTVLHASTSHLTTDKQLANLLAADPPMNCTPWVTLRLPGTGLTPPASMKVVLANCTVVVGGPLSELQTLLPCALSTSGTSVATNAVAV